MMQYLLLNLEDIKKYNYNLSIFSNSKNKSSNIIISSDYIENITNYIFLNKQSRKC